MKYCCFCGGPVIADPKAWVTCWECDTCLTVFTQSDEGPDCFYYRKKIIDPNYVIPAPPPTK